MVRDDTAPERPVADALRALKQAAAVVPPPDPARASALFDAFDAAHAGGGSKRARRDYWYLGGFAAAAVLFLVASLTGIRAGRQGRTDGAHGVLASSRPSSQLPSSSGVVPPLDFVIVPGAAELPRMESGTLVRMDVPVSMLPSLGVTPPPGQARAVTADFIVAQDGLPRAVRLVSP